MWARAFTLAVWAAVAASAVYWVLKLYSPGTPAPSHARPVNAAQGAQAWQGADLTRLLGADEVVPSPVVAAPAEPPADARDQLIGVVAPRGRPGAAPAVALIAVDGKPPRAYRVGAVVSGDTVLRAVRARSADLGQRAGPVATTLQLAAASGAPSPGVAPGAVPPPAAQPRPGAMPGFTPAPPAPMRSLGGAQPRAPGPVPLVALPPRAPVQNLQPQVQEVESDDGVPRQAMPQEAAMPSQRRRMGGSEATR
jgi:general secretion pathway protein C